MHSDTHKDPPTCPAQLLPSNTRLSLCLVIKHFDKVGSLSLCLQTLGLYYEPQAMITDGPRSRTSCQTRAAIHPRAPARLLLSNTCEPHSTGPVASGHDQGRPTWPCHPSFIIRHSSFIIHSSLFIIHYSLFVSHGPPAPAWLLPSNTDDS